jgi:hypothetical protein
MPPAEEEGQTENHAVSQEQTGGGSGSECQVVDRVTRLHVADAARSQAGCLTDQTRDDGAGDEHTNQLQQDGELALRCDPSHPKTNTRLTLPGCARRRRRILRREEDTMTGTKTATGGSVRFAVALGALGGAALIVTAMLTTRGPMVFLPYAAIVVIGAIYLRREQVTPFFRRFGMALGAFMVATALFYLYIVTVAKTAAVDVSLIGHAWRIGLMLAIGSCLSAAVAQLTARAHARARRAAPSPRT